MIKKRNKSLFHKRKTIFLIPSLGEIKQAGIILGRVDKGTFVLFYSSKPKGQVKI